MVVFDVEMDYNGDEFFFMNGKFVYKLCFFVDNLCYVEEKYNEEICIFKISKDGVEWYLEYFEIWYDFEVFWE